MAAGLSAHGGARDRRPSRPELTLSAVRPMFGFGRWMKAAGAGAAMAMWAFGGTHRVFGLESRPGARVDLDSPRNLLSARALLCGDAACLHAVHRSVHLVELWAGFGHVSVNVARRGGRTVRVGYAHG